MLSDGSTARLRPIRPEDRDLLDAFHRRQSQESIYFRYFRFRPELTDTELEYFTNVDYDRRMAFVAELGDDLVAVARYESGKEESPTPEVAFFVDDDHHGKGLATLMLEYLAAVARQKDLEGFTATVLPENYGMLRVFRKAGFDVTTKFVDGVIEVRLGIDVTPEAAAQIDARGRRAQARSVARILEPDSVAVIGASRRTASVGHRLSRAIAKAPFDGPAYAVNPAAAAAGLEEIGGLPLVGDLSDIEESIDLVIIALPADVVETAVESAVAKGVHALMIVSAGFSDEGPEGAEREDRVLALARKHGIRLIGPAAFGAVNTDPAIQLTAMFVPLTRLFEGPVAVLSQSGPLGAALLEQLGQNEVGVSSFVAVGNRADVSTNDLLQYWAADERTSAICLYQPNIGNPRNFRRIARHVSGIKPILAVAPHDEVMTDLLEQSGVMVVDHVEDLVDQAHMVVHQPLPHGNRVAVVANTSSVGSLAATACRRAGLEVVVPPGVVDSVVDDALLIGDADTLSVPRRADAETYERVVAAAALSAEVDLVLVAIVPTLTLSIEALGQLLRRVDRAVDKPMAATGLVDPDLLDVPGLPAFTFPERAALVLGRAARFVAWRQRHHGTPIEADAGFLDTVEDGLVEVIGDGDERRLGMADPQLLGLLGLLDLTMAPYRIAETVEEAAQAASAIGYPVVLKAGGNHDRSTGEAGGTALDLRSDDDVAASYQRMASEFDSDFGPAIVQATAPTGAHIAVELVQDIHSGARLTVGIGGASAKSIASMSTAVLPASESDLDRLLDEPWLADLLPTSAARYSLRDLLARLAVAADASPDVASVRFNPVLVSNTDAVPVEAEVMLRRWPRDPLAGVRHLAR